MLFSVPCSMPLNVREFGVYSGIPDAHAGLTEAIIYAAANGRNVYIPGGDYELSKSLLIDGFEGVELTGDGVKTHLFAKEYPDHTENPFGATQGVVTVGSDEPSSNIALRNMRIDARGALQGVNPADPDGKMNTLALRSVHGVIMEDLHLSCGARDTLYMAGKATTGMPTDISGVFGSRVVVEGSANRRAFSVVDGVEDAVFSKVRIVGNGNGAALALEPGTNKLPCKRVLFDQFLIEGGTSNVLMTAVGEPCEEITFRGFRCRGASGASLNLSKYRGVIVDDYRGHGAGGSGMETGTIAGDCQDLTLRSLHLANCGGRGIWLRSARGVCGHGIRVIDSGSVGVHVSSSAPSEFSSDVRLDAVSVQNASSNGVLIDGHATDVHVSLDGILDCRSDGVMISYPENPEFCAAISGGRIIDSNGSGIRTNFPVGFAGSLVIDGLRATNTAGGYPQYFGIDLDADADFVRLVNCDLRGNERGAISGGVGPNGFESCNVK